MQHEFGNFVHQICKLSKTTEYREVKMETWMYRTF